MPTPSSSIERPRGLPRGLMVFVALVALATLVLEYGFQLDDRGDLLLERIDFGLAAVFGVDLALILFRSSGRWMAMRTRWLEFSLMLLFGLTVVAIAIFGTDENLAEFLGFIHLRSVAKLMLALVQIFLLLNIVLRTLAAQEHLLASRLPSEYLFVGSFAALILLGTVLLWLPGCAEQGRNPITLLEAFFTSTSASCVTGLSVRDTGADFSSLGQVVILVLFQVGGLGVITFVAFGSVLATKSFSVPQTVALRDLTNSSTLVEARRFVWQVVLWMLLIEGVGAALLYSFLPADSLTPLERLFHGVFHAVSAFCNAGFALHGDSLEGMRGSFGVNAVVMCLILLGGLGMPVTRELITQRVSRLPWLKNWSVFQRLRGTRGKKRLSLQTQLSLWMTAALVLIGFVGFWLLESGGVLGSSSWSESALASAFQSVTTRTAGFNTVPMDQLSDATMVLMIGLMAVGAGPISTGGGIKTVTFAVLMITLRAMATGRPGVEVMGRSLPRVIVRSAISVFTLYVMAAGTVIFTLSITDPGIPFRDRCFVAISALSTVGLATTTVASFSPLGLVTLCAAMFVGRVGPLALVLSVFRARGAHEDYQYPEEDLVVG
ncbi:MAG: hypothetical protein H6831_15165 [Planctomycetes bacterium]|nr:hypothetical protein [Planctomycetota bacterium]MCB9905742.1 hypothetical protein [Planctomycetota bacterium]